MIRTPSVVSQMRQCLSLRAPGGEACSERAVARELDDVHGGNSSVGVGVAGQDRASVGSIHVELQVSVASTVGPLESDGEVLADGQVVGKSLRGLGRDLRAPELGDVGVCASPSRHGLGSDPDHLNVVRVWDVEGVVSGLASEEVEGVVQNQSVRICASAIDTDCVTCAVRLCNVRGGTLENRSGGLVCLRNVSWVAKSGLSASLLVGVGCESNACVAAGRDRRRVDDLHSTSSANLSREDGGGLYAGRSAEVRGNSRVGNSSG